MLIPAWIMITIAVIVAAAVFYLCLVLRRALTELFFWRGAFVRLQDAATELFDVGDGRAVAGRATETRRSALKQYRSSLELMNEHARYMKIDWVSEADRDYYREHFGPEPELAVDGASRPEKKRSETAVT